MTRKYNTITEVVNGVEYWRPVATRMISRPHSTIIPGGTVGGRMTRPDWLAQDGLCWAEHGTLVDGPIRGDAQLLDRAVMRGELEENAVVSGDAHINKGGCVKGHGSVGGHATVGRNSVVCDRGVVRDRAVISNDSMVYGTGRVMDTVRLHDSQVSAGYLCGSLSLDRSYVRSGGMSGNGSLVRCHVNTDDEVSIAHGGRLDDAYITAEYHVQTILTCTPWGPVTVYPDWQGRPWVACGCQVFSPEDDWSQLFASGVQETMDNDDYDSETDIDHIKECMDQYACLIKPAREMARAIGHMWTTKR
jgi:hypothetical protein